MIYNWLMAEHTSSERRDWIARYRETGNISLVCREVGISRPTFYKWLKRANPEKPSSPLRSQSRRPKTKRLPRKWSVRELNILADIDYQMRGRLSAEKLSHHLADRGVTLSRSTVGRILRKPARQCPICKRPRRLHDTLAHLWYSDRLKAAASRTLIQEAEARPSGDGTSLEEASRRANWQDFQPCKDCRTGIRCQIRRHCHTKMQCQARIKWNNRQCKNEAAPGREFCNIHASRVAAAEGLHRN